MRVWEEMALKKSRQTDQTSMGRQWAANQRFQNIFELCMDRVAMMMESDTSRFPKKDNSLRNPWQISCDIKWYVMRRKISKYRLFETDLEIFLMTHLIGKYRKTKLKGLCSMIIAEELEMLRSKAKTET